MALFGNPSIRSVLGAIIGVLGLFLIGQLATGLFGAIERNGAAQKVERFASTDQQLFATLLGFRLERGTFLSALVAEGPANANADNRIATNRQLSEAAYKSVLERLDGVSDSRLAGALSKLVAIHDALTPLRSKAETAIHQAKAERDAKVGDEFRKAAQDYLDAILALTAELENALKLTDPVVDHLLGVKQSAWAARNFGGLVAIRLETAAASGKPWSAADMVGAAEDTGRAKQAWSQVQDVAGRADAPASLSDVVARSKQGDAAAMTERQQGFIKALSNNQTIDIKIEDLSKLNTAILNYSVEAGQVALAEMVARAGQQMTSAKWSLALNGGMMLVALAITIFGFILVNRRVSAPIRKLTQAMRSLAERDYAIELAGIERGDEIGEMSRAVSVFRENMITGDRLAEEKAAEQGRKERRQLAVDGLIEQFEKTVTESLHTLASASGELNATAQSMSSTAEQGSSKAASVASLSGDASSNVQTVAAATEELSASITEISRQVAESSSIAGAAAGEADRTNAEVQALADAAQRIGDVVALITGIAEQTNLLALNATIEAARAGEAGRGFAVVASEVKNLATQTAKATEEITGQVAAIQGATKSSVTAIQSIGTTIQRVNEIAAAIAAAVEEQGAATREIARNVQQASQGTNEVSRHISGVSQAAGQTGAAAGEVLDSAQMLARLSDDLKRDVDRFVGNLRAA
ncbi:HAMP domain-containing methyl-accepting chemotaxis protein [Bradyrhizobium sp. LTSP857]|uniref:methyl-accepting chemotaxis protein n=1 Tax=Bradyrhizobium sp. LTSP857 TaxID=1619231 RepID=UPI0005D1D172|nr:HAMP domain-containing methyl-accepting chemotaxis protein [Bradyrhizobium sp. LTSP857]KJC44094.1 chemotaxis protein [Bradyrhizobium sp. LTSP857]